MIYTNINKTNRSLRGGLHPGHHLHAIHMVYTIRAGQASWYCFLWDVRGERHFAVVGGGHSPTRWEERSCRVEMDISQFVLQRTFNKILGLIRMLVEGLFTILVALVLLLAFPGNPTTTTTTMNSHSPCAHQGFFVRFSETDQGALMARRTQDKLDEGGEGAPHHHHRSHFIPLSVVWSTLLHYRRWPHYILTACAFSTWSPLTTYTPSIIM